MRSKSSGLKSSGISWLKEIIGCSLIAIVLAAVVWFFGSVIGDANIDVVLVLRIVFFVTLGLSTLNRIHTVLWIFCHAFIRKVKYRDMSEALRVHKMHKDKDFKELREQAFVDALNQKRAIGKFAEELVNGLFSGRRR